MSLYLYIKNNDKSKKNILRGQRNVRYYERILSNKKNFIISRIDTDFVNFLENGDRYNDEFFNIH